MVSRALIRSLALAAALLTAPMASAAMTQAEVNDALRGNSSIYNALFTAAIIHHVAETCDTLGGPGRLERVAFFLPLYRQARSMGFSRAQIEAFVDDEAEQDRMRQLVYRHLEREGVAPNEASAVCAYGRQQIEERTPIGRRLSER